MSPLRPRRRLGLRAATLALGLASTSLGAAAPVSAAPGDEPAPPPLKVTVSNVVVPRYSDDLTFRVTSTGVEPAAVVSHDGVELADQVLGEDDTFSIPTTGRFKPGRAYRLDIDVATETSSGTSTVTFEPHRIGSTVTPSGSTISYSAPLYGVLTPTRPTPVAPSGGEVYLRHEGLERASYPVRTDGTFALRDATLLPGTYADVHVGYDGDEAYAPSVVGGGLFVGDLTVVKMPTAVTTALTEPDVGPGGSSSLLASVASTDEGTTADVAGELVLSAAPAGTQDFTEISRRPYPGGAVAVEVPLDDFVSTHGGAWTIRTAYSGSATAAAASGADRALTIRTTGATPTTTSLSLAPGRVVAHGGPVEVRATVRADDGPTPTGVAVLRYGSEERRVALVDGTATAAFAPGPAGARTASADYTGSTTWAPSQGDPARVVVAKAPTTTVARVVSGGRVAATVAAPGSTTVLTGAVHLSEGGRRLASATVTGGRAVLGLPALPGGRHTLAVAYAGDADSEASRTTVVVTVPAAASRLGIRAVQRPGGRFRITASVRGARGPASGRVEVREGRALLARGTLRAGRVVLTTTRLTRGAHRLRVSYLGTSAQRPASRTARVRVR